MIPKIIHQTWKTNQIPEKFRIWHDSLIQLHPGWEIKLWTDEDNLELVKQHFPHLLTAYNALQYNIMRVDLVRYMYMSVYGGFYLDLDYELFIPLDVAAPGLQLMLPVSRESGKPMIGNCIFGSVPGNLFWKDILDEFEKNPPARKFFNKLEILNLTGPGFISDIYFKAPNRYNGTLVEKKVFHPDNSFLKKKNYKKLLLEKGSWGIHHCNGSWLKENNSLINYLLRGKVSVQWRLKKLLGE